MPSKINSIGSFETHFIQAIIEIFSDEKVQKLSIPVLFISGKDDELVPPGMMHKLYRIVLFDGKEGSMMKSVISSDKHMLNQRERDALHHGPLVGQR